jgi:beta-lactamase regulating signal transducer with metallopeptidase domain
MVRLVELLNAFGQWLVAHLGRMSVELAILAVVVLGAIWLLRVKSPKFRHLFWCLVLAKPVATFLIASPLSLYWFLRPEPEQPPPSPPAVVSTAPMAQARPPMMRMPERQYPTIPMEVPDPVPAWRQVDKEGAASLGWLVIAAIFGMRLVMGCAYVGFLRQSAERQHVGPMAEVVAEASRALGVRRRVTIALSNVAHGPVLAGVFRPVILIPKTMAEALSDEQLKMVITHEVAHARRWDNLVLLVQRLAEMFLFFHPVVWLCGWIMRREAEAACDDAVVEAYGDWADGHAAAAYADSLTRVAEMKCGLTRRLLVNTFAAAESNFKRRVRRLLTGRAGRMTLGLSALSMAALVVIACVGLPTAAMRKDKEEGESGVTKLDLYWAELHMDTFAMTMARVASHLGRETDYETMQVLSGEAFAPGIDPTESCAGKWNRQGADVALPFIADTLGLTIESIPLPPAPGRQGDWDKTRAAWAEHRKQVAPQLRQAIDSGAVVLTDGGWEYTPPEFPNVYTFWGVVTEARDDGTILGAVFTNDRHDNPIGFVRQCWAVTKSTPRVTPQETRIEALKLGLARIRQNTAPFLGDQRLFGLAAMDRWAERFEHVPFCGDDCGPKAPRCPLSNSVTMCEAALNAAAYLRSSEQAFHESIQPHLREAARQYDVIAETLTPFTKWETGYEPIMGEVAKQKAHIPVIRSCRDALAAAGDALAAALEGQGVPVADVRAPLKTNTETLLLDNIPLAPAKGNAFAAGLASIVKWWGTESDYDTIMGDSGLAFIIQGDANGALIDGALDLGWWPLDPWGAALRVDFLAQTLGHELRFMQADLDEWKADPAAYYHKHWDQDVRASLERGQAVLAEGATWSLILGMDDGDPPLLGRCAAADKADVTRFDTYPWALVLPGGAKGRLDRREADIQALQHAAALGRDALTLPNGRSAGQKTYALWAATLRDTEQIGQARWHHNVLGHLQTSRESAVSYLREMAKRHPGEVARHLNAAADRYEDVLAELKKADFTGEKMISKEGREELARFVEGLAVLDAQAVDEIALALRAAGVESHEIVLRAGDGGPDSKGQILLDGKEMPSWQALEGALTALKTVRPNAEVVIRPDPTMGHAAVDTLLKTTRSAGIDAAIIFAPYLPPAEPAEASDASREARGERALFHGLDLASATATSVPEELPDLWEERPSGSKSYEIRDGVYCVYQGLDGAAYYIPEKNAFYVQSDPIGSSTQTFYGPFEGNPIAVLDLEDAERRLLAWQNIFGWSLEECVEGANANPTIYELLELEQSLDPISEDARIIREAMVALEPADLLYWEMLENIVKAIGSDGLEETQKKDGNLIFEMSGRYLERWLTVHESVRALELWKKGVSKRKARTVEAHDRGIVARDRGIVDGAYESLGRRNATKERLVDLTLAKLKTYLRNHEVQGDELESLRDDLRLRPFAHRIEMLDTSHWSFKDNLNLLLRCIGQEEAIGEWHKPGGALAWSDGNPEDEPKVGTAVLVLQSWLGMVKYDSPETYEAWLDGPEPDPLDPRKTSLQGLPRSLITTLGERGTYPEKEWLVRCLLFTLQNHEKNYYDWWKETVTVDINGDGIEEEIPFFSKPLQKRTHREETTVKREGERAAIIGGIPHLAWGQGKDNTFAGSLEAATSVTDHPLSYADIMGLTGLAFRVRWSNDDTATKWCASCAIGEMPDEITTLSRLAGWELPADVQFGEENPDREAIRAKVATAIDAGKPVAAYGSCLDLAVVYGYEGGGRTLLLTDYHKAEDPFRLSIDELGPMQVYLGESSEPSSPRDALLEALTTAVVNWKRERHDGGIPGREYWYGDAALRAWQHDLVSTDGMAEDTLKTFHHLNKWNYMALKDARASAVAFLRWHAELLGDEARTALLSAATKYQGELDHLKRWEQRAERPWHSETPAEWTNAVRNSEREALTSIRRTEREAIALIEKALNAEGVELPAVAASAPAIPSTPVKQLESFRWKPMWNSHVASMKAAADELGVEVSVPWLYGTTGYAFLINVHEAMCPSSWHVVNVPVKERVAGAGLDVEYLTDPVHTCDRKPEMQQRAWDGVRKAIDAGRPCYGYDFDVGDYYAVYGYDDVGYYYSGPQCIEGKGPLPWQDYGVTNMIGIIYMLSVGKGSPGDDVAVVRDALVLALQEAQRLEGASELYRCGLAGYDQWIQSLETGKAEGFGTSYNAQTYAESRKNAVEFLKEARARLNGKVDVDFDTAIAQYEAVAENLRIVAEVFPFIGHKPEHIQDKKRVAKAVEALKAARAAEEKGLRALAALEVVLREARSAKRGDLTSHNASS